MFRHGESQPEHVVLRADAEEAVDGVARVGDRAAEDIAVALGRRVQARQD